MFSRSGSLQIKKPTPSPKFPDQEHLLAIGHFPLLVFPNGKISDQHMTPIDSANTLGNVLRAARKQLGLTQADLALAAGVGVRFVVELEAGKPTVRLEQVLRVIDALGGELQLDGLADQTNEETAHHGA